MRSFTFSGPTITPEEVADRCPGVIALPPIEHGDALRVGAQPGDALAIIDGHFFQALPIRHRELAELLERGVRVYGASSLGALRAVELAPLGMRGVGRVFEDFRDGVIDGDDEVAVLHGPPDDGFRPFSEALVNIRATLQRAVAAGRVDASSAAVVIACAKSMPFHERTYPRILAAATRRGLSAAAAPFLAAAVEELRVDRKREDAELLLRELEGAQPPGSPARTGERPPSIYLRRLQEETRDARGSAAPARRPAEPAARAPGGAHCRPADAPTTAEVLAVAQAIASDYPAFHRVTSLEVLGALHHREAEGSTAGRAGEELGRLRDAIEADGREDWDDWLRRQALDEDELGEWLAIRADARAATGASGPPAAPAAVDDLEAVAIDLGRRRGVLPRSGPLPAPLTDWLADGERDLPHERQAALFMVRACQVRPGVTHRAPYVTALKLLGALPALIAGRDAARALNADLAAKGRRYSLANIGSRTVVRWWLERWRRLDAPHVGLVERGFTSREELLDRTRWLLPLDRLTDEYRAFRLTDHASGRLAAVMLA